jgi:CHC2-type zinc finger protein
MTNQNGDFPTLDDVRDVLERDGRQPVLIYIEQGSKAPAYKGWNTLTYAQTQTPLYQSCLNRFCNTAVLLGGYDNICTIDCDTETMFAETLSLNPAFASTLISQGERGGQIWLYVTGNRPHKVEKLRVRKGTPLAFGAKKIEPDGTVEVGEFRAEGGASIIRGIHPCGCCYRWRSVGPLITVGFDAIVWHPDIIIPWGHDYCETTSTTGDADHDSLLKRAIAIVTVDQLWQHFGFKPRGRANPVCSPFRDERHPSFSVYDEGRRWKDHGTGEGGDAFDFYQRATGKSAKDAFVEFIEFAGLGAELEAKKATAAPADAATGKPQLVLPSGAVSFTDVADKAFPVLAAWRRYFVRDRLLVEIAYQKQMKDNQVHDVLQLLEPDAFRSRIEHDFKCVVWREKGDKYVQKPGRCTNDAAKALLKTDEAFKHLPAISFLSAQPVCTIVGDELKILYRGYHDVHGGIYVSHGDKKIKLPELGDAVALILDALKDFDFVSESDKSRAVAALISPALRIGKFLGDDADFPIDISEGNESQSGKTFRLKLICAIYGETPYVIANREGGVGSLDESISSALLAGIPFILFENFRGRMNSQLVESCLRGTGIVPARIPYRGEAQVSTSHINWQLSSNGIEATRDFVNRAVINRISKRPDGYAFATYPEGNILAHIKANQPMYQGAVFRVIKQWFDEGCSRTSESRHDMAEWAQTLDWIVKLFDLPPLLDGHTEEVLRVSDPALSWLRQIGIAVEHDGRLGQGLSASDIVDICQAHNIEFPNKTSTTDLEQLARLAGRLLGRVFRDVSVNEELGIDRYKIKRESSKQTREDGGDYIQNHYWFSKRA